MNSYLRLYMSLMLTLVAMALAACAAALSKVDTGEAVIAKRLVVNVDSAWNRFESGVTDNTPTWTVEGITIDALQFYVGIKDGDTIASAPADIKAAAPLKFSASMQPAEVVTLYQSLYTRDGSSFTLDKLEPADFVGAQGFRFEYTLLRKVDDVRLSGVAWGAIRNGELFVINYSAPRLGFFPKYVVGVEALAKSARVRS